MREEELRAYRDKAMEKDRLSIENRLNHAFNQGYELGRQTQKGESMHVAFEGLTEEQMDNITRHFTGGVAADDPVSHPSHYTNGSIECIDAMEAAFGRREVIIFSKLNAFKYIWRAELKNNELQDLEKAGWYLNKAIELLKEEAESGMEKENLQQRNRCNCDHG